MKPLSCIEIKLRWIGQVVLSTLFCSRMRSLKLLLLLPVMALGIEGGAVPAAAQEFDCSVQVDISSLSGSEFSFLEELEAKVESYFNEERWTEDRFQPFERISCTVQIFFQEATGLSDFRAQLVVASRRPIYATTQQTSVIRLRDAEWNFSYTKGEPLVHNTEQYDDFTSVLDFYACLMLGYDYDTFSSLGGTPHFEEARRIAELAQSTGASGWAPVGRQGRSTLITQILDPRYRPLREAYFQYHYAGLDRFVNETKAARRSVLEALESIQALNQEVAGRYPIDLFFASKYEELAALFEEAPSASQAYTILSQLDAAHMSAYENLR